MKDNNLWADTVVYNGGSKAVKNGYNYIFTTAVGYLMTTSDLYEGDENFANFYSTSGKSGWTDSGLT